MSGLEAIAVIGFVFQVVESTITVIDLWKSANEVGEDVVIIKARLDMTRARLKSWALDWGLKEGKHVRHPRFREYGFLAVRYLLIIQYRLTAIENFEKKFPALFNTVGGANRQGSAQRVAQLAQVAEASGPGVVGLKELQVEVSAINRDSIIQRWRWARKDGKGMKMVEQVATLVGELEDFFVPPVVDPIAPVVFSQQQVPTQELTQPEPDHLASPEYRNAAIVGALASFKAATSRMVEHTEALQHRELMRSHRDISDRKSVIAARGSAGKRSLGTFRPRGKPSIPVLIEWMMIPEGLPDTIKEGLSDQIHDLGLLLNAANKPTEFRTLDCVAVVDMPVPPKTDAQYGLVFKLDGKQQVFTLYDLLTSGDFAVKSLSHVLHLAQTLSKAILFLHLGGWLHKGIRSDNILFFADTISNVKLGEAYIGGFEYSRSFAVSSLTQNVGDDEFENLYRHPDHQGLPLAKDNSTSVMSAGRKPFSYEADLYSFGVLMMEICLWSTASQIYELHASDQVREGSRARQIFLDTIPSIKVRMGDALAESTSLCLQTGFLVGETGQPESIQEAFYLSVVRTLDRCFL
jgi:hypothetical protein